MTRKEYYNSILGDFAKLRQFFAKMPKGGDLHNHLTGSAYAETYFEIACKKKMYADLATGKLYKNTDGSRPSTAIQLSKDMANLHNTRMTLIDKWSIRNFQPYKCALGPDEYFFGEFGLFGAVKEKDDLVRFAHELKVRATQENVLYLEIMGTSPSIPTNAFLSADKYQDYTIRIQEACKKYNYNPAEAGSKLNSCFTELLHEYEQDYNDNTKESDIRSAVSSYVLLIKDIDNESWTVTHPFDTCVLSKEKLTVRYQGYASRTKDPMVVFAQLYIVHKAIQNSDLIVGCNIVAAENSENSMLYYKAHMAMFKVLHENLSSDGNPIPTSLHAGELTMGLIRPEHLTYHINDAVNIAEAYRIGHGVDIPFERDSEKLLSTMVRYNTPVEINLSSNEFILGEMEGSHPFRIYKDAKVPLILCTDDPGILRASLTEEYALAAYRYKLSFDEIKKICRNSILYSFLPKADKDKMLSNYDNQMVKFESEKIEVPQEIVIEGYVSVPAETVKESCQFKESGKDNDQKCSQFDCPSDNLIVSRSHHGDENGCTSYGYGMPEICFDAENKKLAFRHFLSPTVMVGEDHEVSFDKESNHSCQCSAGECFVGRTHKGDENGATKYRIAPLEFADTNGFSYEFIEQDYHKVVHKESDNEAMFCEGQEPQYWPMTGREHHGDENANTTTKFSFYRVIFRKKLD